MAFPVLPKEFEAILPDKAKSVCEVFSKLISIFTFFWKIFTWMVKETDQKPTPEFMDWLGPTIRPEPEVSNEPGVPSNLVASDTLEARIELTWANPADANRIDIYRGTTDDVNAATRILGPVSVISNYTDTGVTAGTTYYYWVRAYNAFGYGNFCTPDTGMAIVVEEPEQGNTSQWKCVNLYPHVPTIAEPNLELTFTGNGSFYWRMWAGGGAGSSGTVLSNGKRYVGAGGGGGAISSSQDGEPLQILSGDVLKIEVGLKGIAQVGPGGPGGNSTIKLLRGTEEIIISTTLGGQGGTPTTGEDYDELGLGGEQGSYPDWLGNSAGAGGNPGLNSGISEVPVQDSFGWGGVGLTDIDLLGEVLGKGYGPHGGGGNGGAPGEEGEHGKDGAICYMTTASHTINQHV